jgi:hypothetical protein
MQEAWIYYRWRPKDHRILECTAATRLKPGSLHYASRLIDMANIEGGVGNLMELAEAGLHDQFSRQFPDHRFYSAMPDVP